jgi:hypothetical protein
MVKSTSKRNLLVPGDSMVISGATPPPDEVLKGLRKWLDKRFGWKVMNLGNVLERPHQTDTYSCSICTMSTIAHGIFGDPLWQQRNASVHRIHWLLKLGKYEGLYTSQEPVCGLG